MLELNCISVTPYASVPNHISTWVDQKVLKLLAYLFEYSTELYKTYTEYGANISYKNVIV